MSQRRSRFLALTVLAAVLLGAAGVVAWDWIVDYRLYRRSIVSLAPPGQEPTSSFEEFLKYRRAIAFYDAAERLAEKNATSDEVRTTLGEPDYTSTREAHGVVSWFYSGPVFRGHRNPTIVMDIDAERSRVSSVGYIHHN